MKPGTQKEIVSEMHILHPAFYILRKNLVNAIVSTFQLDLHLDLLHNMVA